MKEESIWEIWIYLSRWIMISNKLLLVNTVENKAEVLLLTKKKSVWENKCVNVSVLRMCCQSNFEAFMILVSLRSITIQ